MSPNDLIKALRDVFTSYRQADPQGYSFKVDAEIAATPKRIDVAGGGVTYKGYSVAGALDTIPAWRIKRETVLGAITTIEYADGNDFYDNIWSNRAALSYS